ncbi:MAG: hypothetical protein ABI724_11360 [Betaproteobacteria bacterium]
MTDNRLLLCRPQGGFNDLLCQIELCCRYAERFGRTVIVDTDSHHSRYFKDAFSRYFVSEQKLLILDLKGIPHRIGSLTAFPDFVSGRLDIYRMRYDQDLRKFVEETTGRPISFDFNKDYSEPLLVHDAAGGGTVSLAALYRVRVQEAVSEAFWARQRLMGSDYTALHIRNTDYKTAYEGWIEQNKGRIHGSVFVATDNRDTLAHCRSAFGAERVFSFAELPPEAGHPAHHLGGTIDAYRRNCDAIVDLFLLAYSKQLYVFKVMPNEFGVNYSGFSMLAVNLRKSGPLLRRLTSIPGK